MSVAPPSSTNAGLLVQHTALRGQPVTRHAFIIISCAVELVYDTK